MYLKDFEWFENEIMLWWFSPKMLSWLSYLLTYTYLFQVICWFQNRRAKFKRDMEELKKDVEKTPFNSSQGDGRGGHPHHPRPHLPMPLHHPIPTSLPHHLPLHLLAPHLMMAERALHHQPRSPPMRTPESPDSPPIRVEDSDWESPRIFAATDWNFPDSRDPISDKRRNERGRRGREIVPLICRGSDFTRSDLPTCL